MNGECRDSSQPIRLRVVWRLGKNAKLERAA